MLAAPAATGQTVAKAVDTPQADSQSPMIVHLHLTGAMTEQVIEDPFELTGGQGTSLRSLVDRLDKLAQDDEAAAVVITLGPLGAGLAQLDELHDAL
ncbi:MAG: hypothetical protein AAF333_00420 [Planctomycetota bacterium]